MKGAWPSFSWLHACTLASQVSEKDQPSKTFPWLSISLSIISQVLGVVSRWHLGYSPPQLSPLLTTPSWLSLLQPLQPLLGCFSPETCPSVLIWDAIFAEPSWLTPSPCPKFTLFSAHPVWNSLFPFLSLSIFSTCKICHHLPTQNLALCGSVVSVGIKTRFCLLRHPQQCRLLALRKWALVWINEWKKTD